MNTIILAGGAGSRMKKSGIDLAKHLLKVNQECLIDRLIRQLHYANLNKILVGIRYLNDELSLHLQQKYSSDIRLIEARGNKGKALRRMVLQNFDIQNVEGIFIFMGDTVFLDEEVMNFVYHSMDRCIDLVIGATNNPNGSSGMLVDIHSMIQSRSLKSDYMNSTGCFFIDGKHVNDIINSETKSISVILNNIILSKNIRTRIHNFSFFYDVNDISIYDRCVRELQHRESQRIFGKA